MTNKNPDWWVYMIRCGDGSLYTGIAMDVEKRFQEHLEQGAKGAKYLRGRGPLHLVLKKKIGDKGLALKIENQIKKLTKKEKEALIKNTKLVKEIIRICGQ